ncbi:PREDICTED: uncharacterized protein LOC109480279 [Branchiostoma belcheri]|uniref:Uncharacterized protein LOC109480279 n=1 Tax=Branchiostoma belcheri TaxID=7741 RepID=A0A6P4Z9H1_BRABE|nr:PREDICTED: uncharacterized protein LOC109480279 [Branchiostoma belcheri]
MTHRSEGGKWCLLDNGPDGVDMKWISSTGSIKWVSDQMGGHISDLYVPQDGDSTSVMVSVRNQKALKMPLATFRGAEDCGEGENCFSELNSNMSQVDFIKMFRVIKDAVFGEWKTKLQSDDTRMPLQEVSSNQKCKPSPRPENTLGAVLLGSPVKLFQSVAGTSRASRSPVKSPKKVTRNIRQKRETQRRINITTIGGTPAKAPTEMEEEEEDILVNLPAKRQQMSVQKSPGKSAKEMEEEETVPVNPAKRQRLSTPKNAKKRDFQDGVIAMRKALIADIKDAYEELGDNECLPAPSATVRAQWTSILQYNQYRQVCNNAKEYRLVARLSKRCWAKVLHIFKLCQANEIVTKGRRASMVLFSPLKGLSEPDMYAVLSTYAESACGAKLDVKTLINSVNQDKEKDKLPTTREMVDEYRKMKSQLKALKEQGITLEEAAQQRETIRELEAELTQLRMFAVDVAQTANSNEEADVKIYYIKRMLEIDSFLDPTTGGFAMELSLSKVEGHPSLHITDEFSPGFSSTMLNGELDAYQAFQDTDDRDSLMTETHSEKAGEGDRDTAADSQMTETHSEKPGEGDRDTAADSLMTETHSEKAGEGDRDTATDSLMTEMDLDKDRWVAVALEVPEGWHIAKLEGTEGNKACVSFLQTGIPLVYKWPSLTDKLIVNIKCIIDKDVEMTPSGTGTRQYWRMSIATAHRLNMLFDEFKVNYW